jgi:hypothetical protein
LSSVNFYILIFFSETTGPIATKLGRNVHLIVPYKVYVFLLITEETRGPKASKMVCPYIWVVKYLNTGTNQLAIGWEITIFIIRKKKFEDAKWVTRKSKKNRECSGFSSSVCLALRIRKAFIKSFNSI